MLPEVYGPDYAQQIAVGKQVKDIFSSTEDVVDVDWMQEDDQPEYNLVVDKEKAMRSGVSPAQVVATVNAALAGMSAGVLHNQVLMHR